MRPRWQSVLLALLVTGTGLLAETRAGTVGSARVVPAEPGLGERAVLELDPAPADSSQWPVGLSVVLRATADPARYQLIPVRVGRVGVFVPTLGDTLSWEVPGRVEAADPAALAPLHGVGPWRPNWWPTLAVALAIAAGLALLIWRFWPRRPGAEEFFELEVEPAHDFALRRLEEIENEGWLRQGRFETFFVEASQVLRQYLTRRFHVSALDATSSEVVEGMRHAGYHAEWVRGLRPLLEAADNVKFAAHRPTEESARQWLRAVRNWISDTAVEPVWSTPEAIAAAERLRRGRV